MARVKKTKKAAAMVDVEKGEPLEAVQQRHGIKSRRTIEGWIAEAKKAEEKAGGSGAASSSGPAPDANATEENVHAGEAEMLCTVIRFGCGFTMKTAGMVVGFAPTSPLVVSLSRLSDDEEAMIRQAAPALGPAWDKLLKWMDGHAVAVFAAMFGAIMLPRVVTLGMAAKKVREMNRAAKADEKGGGERAASSSNGGGPRPAAAASAARTDAAASGVPVIPLYPEGRERDDE